MLRSLPVSAALIAFLLSGWATAQTEKGSAAPATQKGEKAPATAAGANPAERGKADSSGDITTRKDKALLRYSMGEIDQSLSEVRHLIEECDEVGAAACPDPTRAELYVALAIIMAGGKNDVEGGARLFHAALTRDPEVRVPREHATLPVQKAMRLANESNSYGGLSEPDGEAEPQPAPAPAPVPAAPDPADVPPESTNEEEGETDKPRDNKTGLLLLHAMVGSGSDDFGDAPSGGAAAVLGARFVDTSGWTTAVRGRAAVVGYDEALVAGMSLLMGGSWYGERRKRLGYFLGGLGIDSYAGEGGLSLVGMGGVSLGGFLIGGGLDAGFSGYGTYGLMTLHLGWGGRL